jgi:hypothetical protein
MSQNRKRLVKHSWWLSLLPLLPLLPLVVAGCLEEAPREARKDEARKDKDAGRAAPRAMGAIECRWAPRGIRIDGRLNEKAWDTAVPIDNFVVGWEKRKAKSKTTARVLWDDRYFYFAAEMEDSDLYATVKERNGMTWYDDVFELFFKPAVDADNALPLQYYEFQVNALNTHLELFLPSRGSGGYGRFAALTKPMGMESAVKLRGTLNDYRDKDEGWTVEGRIPWSAFKAAGGKPSPGAKWRFALCRYDYSVAFERPELSSTAPLTVPDFHRYEDYNELVFVGP